MSVPLIAVFGSGDAPPADLERARRLGRALAEAGYGVINGGYGGTMEASAAGAREVGGTTVGVTCRAFTFRSGPNPHVQEVVEAPSLTGRIETLLTRAAGYVVLPGGNGTLAELSLAWEHVRKGLLPGSERPIVAWEDPWKKVVELLAGGPYLGSGTEAIVWVNGVDEAVAAIRRRLS
ncbi:MAG: LOG family protein [Gemmatimonadota bacterium]